MRNKIKFFLLFPLFLAFIMALLGCNNESTPKPIGYYRITFPKKEYLAFDTNYPYCFEYPKYGKIIPDKDANSEPYWINLDFNQYNARIHISYKVINNNLATYTEDTRTFVMKHIPKATNINENYIQDKEERVFGIVYDIEGTHAASSFQFYVTDSLTHFLRGALYFNEVPNNDSLAPVIQFIKQDIYHLIHSLKWKSSNPKVNLRK